MKRSTRILTAAIGAIAAGAMLAPAAGAHVTVNPSEATKGGFSKLTFRVPNERPTAGTTQVEVSMPPEHPLRSVSVKPTQGWEYQAVKTPLATPITSESGQQTTETVTKITWSGGLIRPGGFAEFEVSVGPLPENVDEIVFPALQTYEGGEVVRWIDLPTPGGAEPERPAPVLELVAGDEETTVTTTADGSPGADAPISASNVASKTDVDDANRTGVIGIVIGVIGLLAAGVAIAMARKKASAAT